MILLFLNIIKFKKNYSLNSPIIHRVTGIMKLPNIDNRNKMQYNRL